MSLDRACRELEELLQDEGLPVYCFETNQSIFVEEEVPVSIELIFALDQEVDVYRALRKHRDFVKARFGRTAQIKLRTILYHLAYRWFPPIAPSEDYFVSTNVINLHDPIRENVAIDTKTWIRNLYEINLVIVCNSRSIDGGETESLYQRIIERGGSFNKQSRFLQIAEIRVAFTRSKAVWQGDPPLRYKSLPLKAAS